MTNEPTPETDPIFRDNVPDDAQIAALLFCERLEIQRNAARAERDALRAAIVLQQIDAALALAEKATKGPWTAQPADSPQIMSPKNEHCVSTTYGCYATKEDKANNATFIAASRTLLPASLRCLKTAIQAHLETLRGQWRDRATEIAERDLATLCDQWSAAQ